MAGKVGFVSLGCSKALVDSEEILTNLNALGHRTVADLADADVVVINTCGFIDSAVEESFDAIAAALRSNPRVIVTGCLGVREAQIRERFPDLLAITGPQATAEVVAAVNATTPSPVVELSEPLMRDPDLKLTPAHYAYLKIAEGCNHRCSFCIIPSMRGKLRSRLIGGVLREAERLAASGVQELLIIAQDTSAYGVDVGYRKDRFNGRDYLTNLETLCIELGHMVPWVRLHYLYPYPHVDRLLPLMAEGRLLPYLDVPLQHADAAILKAMRRPGAVDNTLQRIRAWRETCPELTIRSTFIVGFPGETDADFTRLLDFLEEAQLDRVGCFTYSAVDGAAANELPDPVEEAVKLDRQEILLEIQGRISARKLRNKRGLDLEVLVDEVGPDGAVARTRGDSPGVDGVVHISDSRGLVCGSRIWVHITDSDTHDLYANHLGNPLNFD
ncbi:MAG: 30S ribosomal protein S12 methylthiotransferase RimO [Gammaproteobacteria bacterium]|nr:30S ribosomal protein S12 methylthiotransferase RimO [Gammaproteobacteria bacterium]